MFLKFYLLTIKRFFYSNLIFLSLFGMQQPLSLRYQAAQCAVKNNLDIKDLTQDCKEYLMPLKLDTHFEELKASIVLGTDLFIDALPDCYRTLKAKSNGKAFQTIVKKLTEYAVLFSNKEALRLLLEYSPVQSNSIIDERKNSLLMYAAHDPDLEISKLLIENGANPATCNTDQKTVLMDAASANNVELLKLLLARINNINAINKSNQSALHFAAESNAAQAALYLLKQGATVNSIDIYGNTPLTCLTHPVAQSDSLSLLQILLDHKANVNHQNKNGATALHRAAKKNSPKVALLLLNRGADVNLTDISGNTPLIYAAAQVNSVPLLQILLNNNAAIDHQSKYGETALYYAAACGRLNTVIFLCNHNANINLKNSDGRLAIETVGSQMSSVNADAQKIFDYLLIKHKKEHSLSLWEVFLSKANLKMEHISSFLKIGPQLKDSIKQDEAKAVLPYFEKMYIGKIIDDTGSTSLHLAARYNSKKVLLLALNYKPNFSIKNKNGRTPLMLARLNNAHEAEDIIKQAMRESVKN